jgi:Rne/Rng family ribonuclease
MSKKILIDAKYKNEIRTVLVNKNDVIEEIECETADTQHIKGNIYLAKVSRIEPALQAAFITYENGDSGFLPFSEIHPDFFILPDNKIYLLSKQHSNNTEKIYLKLPNKSKILHVKILNQKKIYFYILKIVMIVEIN